MDADQVYEAAASCLPNLDGLDEMATLDAVERWLNEEATAVEVQGELWAATIGWVAGGYASLERGWHGVRLVHHAAPGHGWNSSEVEEVGRAVDRVLGVA